MDKLLETTKANKKLLEKLNIRYDVVVDDKEQFFKISDRDSERLRRYYYYGKY